MPRNWIKSVILVFITTFLILSCRHSSIDRNSTVAPVTLKLSGWGSSPTEERLLQQVLRNFEASHPHIRVRFEAIADQYMDVMKTRLIGDAAPDVFYLDAFEAPFLTSQNVLEPLDGYLTPDFDRADFADNLLSPFIFADRIYGFPKDCSTLALYYNKAIFAAAGLTTPPQTWQELMATARKLTQTQPDSNQARQFGFGITPELARQAFTLRAYGGQVVDQQDYAAFASESALRGLSLVVQPYRDRIAAQPSDVGTTEGIEMFGQGRVAMVLEGNWAIPYFQETFPDLDYGTAEVPTINNQPGTMVYTVAYVMNRQSQHKPEAWELIAYLTGKTGMEKWTSTGFALPTRKSLLQQLTTTQSTTTQSTTAQSTTAIDARRAPLIAGISYATPWSVGRHSTAIVNHFNNQFVSALLGEQPLSQAMQRAQQQANQQIQATE